MKRKRFDPARSGKNVKGVTPIIFLIVFFGFGGISNVIYETIFHSPPSKQEGVMPTDDDIAILSDRPARNIDLSTNSTYLNEDSSLISSPDLHPKVDFSVPYLSTVRISNETSLDRHEFKKVDSESNKNIPSRVPNLYFSDQWLKDSVPKVDFWSLPLADSFVIHSRVSSLTSPPRKTHPAPFLLNEKQPTNLQFPISMKSKSELGLLFSFTGDVEFSELPQDINSESSGIGVLLEALNENDNAVANTSDEVISRRTKNQDNQKNAGNIVKNSTNAEPDNLRGKMRMSKALNEKPNEEQYKEYKVIGVFVVGSKRWTLIENVSGQIGKYTIGERIGEYSVAAISDGKVRLANSFGEDILVKAGSMF